MKYGEDINKLLLEKPVLPSTVKEEWQILNEAYIQQKKK
jgi:hypothetical protein